MQRGWKVAALLVLALAGAAISFHLTVIHINHIKTGVPSSCNFNESFNCDAVNTSRWSELFGIPVAHLGMLAYAVMAAFSAAGLASHRFRPHASCYLFLLSAWNLLFSIYMAVIALFVIRSVCVWCASLYGLNIAMLAVAWGGGAREALNFVDYLLEDLSLLKKPAWMLVAPACVLALAGSSLYLRNDLVKAKSLPPSPRVSMNTAGAPSRGPENAPVSIVEISDFECPFCRKASSTLEGVVRDYHGKVRLFFKHFPLDRACNPKILQPFHQNACLAAKAAVCADGRGFFWPFSRKLFAGEISAEAIDGYADDLGFDAGEFKSCIGSEATGGVISRDINDSIKAGVQGVPVFLINGRKIVGAQPPEKFKALIDEELAGR